jgi:hypothetical protein
MEPLRVRDADGVAQVIQAHLDEISNQVVARVRELMANGHLELETTSRRPRAAARRPRRPTLLKPLAG